MTYFAEIKDGKVIRVIVADQEFIDKKLLSGKWIKTFMGNNYAGIGYTYDGKGFIPKRPYPSWTLENYKWKSPKKRPKENKFYNWDEVSKEWKSWQP